MKFEDYRFISALQHNLANLGFRRPTDIQFKAIPAILKGEDVLAIAQTGTGKTAAFAIPVIQLLARQKENQRKSEFRCLVMVPTRELAEQIQAVFKQLTKHTGIKSLAIYGGVEQEAQIKALITGTDILIATPGRMFDLSSQGFISFDTLQYLILDEADHMLDLGFLPDIRQLITRLPRRRQTLFFSATINEHIKDLAYSLVHKPIRIQVSPKDPVSKNVDHSVTFIAMDDKRFFLERLVNEQPNEKILVFVRTKVRAERVLSAMSRVNIPALTLHGDKDQKLRQHALDDFRKGNIKLLIATDVSSRGIDIPDVAFVVNYDLPDKPENYVHRIGRTGRGVQRGKAFSFCSPEEKPMLQEIEQYIGKAIKIIDIDYTTYTETLDFSAKPQFDLKALMKEAEEQEEKRHLKKRKK